MERFQPKIMKGTKIKINLFLACLIFLSTCTDNSNDILPPVPGQPSNQGSGDWLVPRNRVFDGGPGKDGIPSIDNPVFESVVTAANDFPDDWLVIGVKAGNEVKAYPHYILDWHEIVNDEVGPTKIALTYCPLTGTAISWNRTVDNQETTFGVSGLLYNSNLMPYDRRSNSTWSQMRLDAVNGALIGTTIETEHIIETTWGTWKSMFPESQVLTTETGFNRDYGRYPYRDYRTSNTLIFPVENENDDLHPKTRVLGLTINNRTVVYALDHFDENQTEIIVDKIGETDLIVVGNKTKNFIAGFENPYSNEDVTFSAPNNNNSFTVMVDNLGNEYDLFGNVVAGPDLGKQLHWIPSSYIGYYFSWVAFHPDLEVRN